MKKTIKFFNFGVAALLIISAFAISTLAQAQEDPLVAECNTTYEKFLANRKEKPEVAYTIAKEYLQKCAGKVADVEKYLTGWVEKYEIAFEQVEFTKAWLANDFPNIYKYGKLILARDPEKLDVIIKLGFAGFNAEKAKTTAFRGESGTYAKLAIEKLEAGKTLTDWAPFKDKNDAITYLYYTLGSITKDSAPKDSVKYFYKITKIESPLKSDASTYSHIATYYKDEYLKKVAEVKVKCPEGAVETDECKLLDTDVFARLDRWADALARAISYANAKNQAEKDAWTKTLAEIFKQRYNKPEAVNGYVANIQKTPMPDPESELKPAPIMDVTAATTANATGAITTSNETSVGPTPNQTSTEIKMATIAKATPKAASKSAHRTKGKSKRP